MADRSVSVLLKANVAGFVAGIEQAKLSTADFAKATTKNASDHKESWDKVGKGMMLTGGVIAAGVGLAVKTFADFDQSMSRAQAGTMATGSSLASLRKAAIDAGAATQFSATEAADAITAMGKAGVSTKDILGGGLTGALSLAAAGELDVASASEIAATAMNQFGLQGKDIPHIADLLAAGAGKAMGSVQDLAGALKFVGPVAKGLGISIEETTGTLAMFAQAGILGEQAGTSMRGMLTALTSPSKIAKGAMDDLGMTMYDAQGKFVGLDGVAGQLHDKLGPLDEATRNQALGQIFGNEQITAARVLYEGGAGAVQEWTAKVDDAGFAAKQAAMLTDNLKGDVERLGGSLSSVLINAGSGANGMLRTMTQHLQGLVDGYGSLPVPMQKSAIGFGAVTGAGLLLTGALISVVPKIAATKKALAEMEVMSGRSGTALKGLGKAAGIAAVLTAAAAAMALFDNAHQNAVPGIEATTAAILKNGDAAGSTMVNIDALFKGLDRAGDFGSATPAVNDLTSAFKRLTDKSGVDSFSDSIDGLFGAINGATKSEAVFTNIGTSLGQLVTEGNAPLAQKQFDAMATTLGLTGTQTDVLMKLMPAYGEAIAGVGNETTKAAIAATGATGPTAALGGSEADLAKAADEAKKAHDALTASVSNFGSAMLIARGDEVGYEAAIDAATASVKENGRTLDVGTEKGRNNRTALDAIATSSLKWAESSLTAAEANGTLAAASKTVAGDVNKARTEFINTAVSMGMNKTEAGKLATQMGLTGGRVKEITDKLIALGGQKPNPTVNANTGPAAAKLAALQRQLDAATQDKTVNLRYYVTTSGKAPSGGSVIPGINVGNSADGQKDWRGGLTWVGERGPEILNLPKGSQVIPNDKIGTLATGTGSASSLTEKIAKAAAAAAAKGAAAAAAAAKSMATTQREYQFTYLPVFAKALTGTTSALMTAGTSLIAQVAKTAAAHQMSSTMITTLTNENKVLDKLATSRDSIAVQLKDANQALTDAQTKFANEQTSVTSSLGAFDMSKSANAGDMITQLQDKIKTAALFGDQIKTLGAGGLNASMLKQLADAGPAGEGSPLAQMMGATPDQIAQINTLMAQLQVTASETGTGIATSLYGSGVDAAKGLVAGLESQQKTIETQMLKIASSMQSAIKKALGIRSPSTVMRGVGAFTGAGFALGIADQAGLVAQQANLLAVAAVPRVRLAQYVSAPTRSQSSASGSAGASSSDAMTVTVPVSIDGREVFKAVRTISIKEARDAMSGTSGIK